MFAPPSLVSMKMFGLSGLNQTTWSSPCGVSTLVNVLPPSVEWWKAELRDPDVVLVLRVDEHLVEVERPRAQPLAAVHAASSVAPLSVVRYRPPFAPFASTCA